jgi:hypothetical protein
MDYPYFTGRTTALFGQFRTLDTEGLKRAVVKMGGTMAKIGEAAMPDNIVMGWYVSQGQLSQIEAQYPHAILMMEAKIDDFVQEIDDVEGIRSLF